MKYEEDDNGLYSTIAKKYKFKEDFERMGEKGICIKGEKWLKNFVIQGEIIGPGIQKNKYKLTKIDLYVYQVYDIDAMKYLNYLEMDYICSFLNLKIVPLIELNFLIKNHPTVEDLVELAKGKSRLNENTLKEGIVIRPMEEIIDDNFKKLHHGRISFKVINPTFLVKYDC